MLDLSQSAMLSSPPNSKLQHFVGTTMKIEATLIASSAIWILDAVESGRSMKNLLEVSSQHEFPLARNNPEEIDVFWKEGNLRFRPKCSPHLSGEAVPRLRSKGAILTVTAA